MRKLIDIVLVISCSLSLAGCPDDKSSEETGPASGGTSGEPAAGETGPEAQPARPEAMPLLCSIDGGKWCSPCPSGDAGPLCCAETCVPWVDGDACGGVVGWCPNYTTAGKVSTCHGEP